MICPRTVLRGIACNVLLLALPPALRAQAPAGAGLGGGVYLESYSFSNASAVGAHSLSLLTVPLAARLPLGPLRLDAGTNYARGSLGLPGGAGSVTISGLTDTQVGVSLPVGDVTLSGFGLLPTGVSKLTDAQASLAGKIAADLLPFRITNWGTGGGYGLGSTAAHRFGDTEMGGSAAYVLSRKYDALEGFAYRPGNEARLRLGIESRVGGASSLGLQLTFQKSAVDQANGQNLFRSGTRLQALASYGFAQGARSSGMLYGGILHRSAGSFLTVGQTAASQDLVLAGGLLRVPLGRGVLEPAMDGRAFRSADGIGQGWVVGAGASLQWPLAGRTVLLPTLRGRFGHSQAQVGLTTGITGFEVGLAIGRTP